MAKVGEHITIDIIGNIGQEYDPPLFENVICKIFIYGDNNI